MHSDSENCEEFKNPFLGGVRWQVIGEKPYFSLKLEKN